MSPRPSSAPALTARQFNQVAKALADPRRVELLQAISSAKEFPCQQLCKDFPVSKGTISHHMKELIRAGLIRARRDGQYKIYEVIRETVDAYTEELSRRLS